MFDLLDEILATMKRNKMRTFLTGFAVSWGIFMLIVLLGAGQGLQNGVRSNFANRAVNSVTLWPGWTSKPHAGYRADRRIRFDERTVDFVRRAIPEAEYVSASLGYNPGTTSFGENYGAWSVQSCPPEMLKIRFLKILKGRFINEADMKARRKVIVISRQAAETLFEGEEPLGKTVTLGGRMAFQVAGVYDTEDGMSFSPPNYIPLSVGMMLFDRGWGIGRIDFTIKGVEHTQQEADRFTERVRATMGRHLRFDPTDTSAIYVNDSARQAGEMSRVFGFINIFLWVIGFACVMAGIVGVGNIMLVTVKERTREIGIRKALGATPWSVIKMVIIEAIFITTVAGYIGILMGIGVTELVAKGLAGAGGGGGDEMRMNMFADPTVGLGIVFAVLALLVACGVVAGLIPSLKATRIRPIEAMRAD